MAASKTSRKKSGEVTRYTFPEVHETRVPETGHTPLLPGKEEMIDLNLENGWAKGLKVGVRPDLERPVLVDMDPMVDPVLFWSGKRSSRRIPLLPLQRNEIVSESKIRQIVEATKEASLNAKGQRRLSTYFSELEKSLRESDRDHRVEFYTHDGGWKNKLICGDSLLVMEALLKYEGLRGQVQTIFMDPPYGIKYNSNFQQRIDTTENDDHDKSDDVVTVKAFRDIWTLGVHSYLQHLVERLYLCRELLTESGSVFVQINDEHVHRVRLIMDEVFGANNFCSLIAFQKTTSQTNRLVPTICDYLVWYAKDKQQVKFSPIYVKKTLGGPGTDEYVNVEDSEGNVRHITDEELEDPTRLPKGARVYATDSIVSEGGSPEGSRDIEMPGGITLSCGPNRHWKVSREGILNLWNTGRLVKRRGVRIYKRFFDDFPYMPLTNVWTGLRGEPTKWYTVQTSSSVVDRCILMTSAPGDLVFDPTCGSGTTAYCAESWGRRWITCDTSRVSINVARRRLLGSTFAHFKTRGTHVSTGFKSAPVTRVTQSSLAYGLEPEKLELVDHPEIDRGVVRVTGPFEVLSVGRYSVDDWKGSFVEAGTVENYINVICRLYRKDASPQTSKGLIHSVVESQKEKFAISVGPVSGRVTAKQLNDAAQDALACGLLEVHVLGWAFEANVGEIKAKLESQGKVKMNLVVIRPDTLMEGLKTSQPGMLFSPLSLPDILIRQTKSGASPTQYTVSVQGVGVYERERRVTDYKKADSGYISAWYLDEDYDGDCFVDCQMFFDFKRVPNLSTVLSLDPEEGEFSLKTESGPFMAGKYGRVAVKVVDVYGNESTVVKSLPRA
jgi:adenine-specific DNA-methyltransferase